jgi:cell division protease FtsH
VRALIEAAHTEAWEILNTYRDVLDELVFELLEVETLTRKDLERIFSKVEKRPRITAFNDFGGRTPSDKPPIQSPAERAKERGEPWPPAVEPKREPTPVGSYPGGSNGSLPLAGPNGRAAAPDPRPSAVPHNYGAPPDWRPATTPSGQQWPPAERQWPQPGGPGNHTPTAPQPVTGPGSPWAAPGRPEQSETNGAGGAGTDEGGRR